MHARAVEDARAELRELRLAEWEDLGLAALVLALALAATQLWRELALPLFLGGLFVGVLGMRAVWRRWDVVDRLSGEPGAYAIPEVFAHASREATMDRRRSFAALIRSASRQYELEPGSRAGVAVEELEELCRELEDEQLRLDPASAVACAHLLTDPEGSPLLYAELPPEELLVRVRHIRTGFHGGLR